MTKMMVLKKTVRTRIWVSGRESGFSGREIQGGGGGGAGSPRPGDNKARRRRARKAD